MPLEDEPTEMLARPALQPAGGQPEPPHPPRAVVRRRRARRNALEWPLLIVFALVSAYLIRAYVVQTFYIPSASMHETLVEGDRVLVNKVGYHLHDIHRGDVIVFAQPPNLNVNDDDLIKRVIGAARRDGRGPRRQGVRQRRTAQRAVRRAGLPRHRRLLHGHRAGTGKLG